MKTFKSFLTLCVLGMTFNVVVADVHCPEDYDVNQVDALLEVVENRVVSKVSFNGEITKSSIDSLIKRIDKAIAKNTGTMKEIIIDLDSGGGNINEAIRAINYIRKLNRDPAIEMHTKVSSYSDCESACTILYTAGEKRFASRSSKFGFHSPKFESGNKAGMTKREIEERYRKIWLNYVSAVDPAASANIDSRRYLLDEEMSYISGRDLNTGYVTDFI